MTHVIKLREAFANAVMSGDKLFEIRENDRGYQRGDCLRFVVVDEHGKPTHSDLTLASYRITYVLSGWGLKEGYVALGIEKVRDE